MLQISVSLLSDCLSPLVQLLIEASERPEKKSATVVYPEEQHIK